MRDIHPSPHPASSWREFFIHIATIVLGLLIAIGLEQTVERIHKHYELRDTREALVGEMDANRKDIQADALHWRVEMAELENNLLVLRYVQQNPNAPQTALPGVLMWDQSPVVSESAVWDAAQQNGMTQLMLLEEANQHRARYAFLALMGKQGVDDWNAYNDAARYTFVDGNPTHLSPPELARLIEALQFTMEKHLQVGEALAYIHNKYPELGSPLTFAETDAFVHQPWLEDPIGMAAAYKLTEDRLKAAGYSDK
jgi:hypothetical protein